MKKLTLIFILIGCLIHELKAQIEPDEATPYFSHANVKVLSVKKEGTTTLTQLRALAQKEKAEAATYFDDFGRPIYSVAFATTVLGKDIVQPYRYGSLGQVETAFLPFERSSVSGNPAQGYQNLLSASLVDQQSSFYNSATNGWVQDANPYSVTTYEKSPLMRPLESGAPGADWQPGSGHTIKNNTFFNDASFVVKIWKEDATSSANYPNNKLVINELTDENGNRVRTVSDLLGNLLRKEVEVEANVFLVTLNIYDASGRLKYTIQPEGVRLLGSANTISSVLLEQFAFEYVYDDRGRLKKSKTPQSGWSYFIYDQLGRLAFSQNELQKVDKKWNFVKHDHLGRTAYTGIATITATDKDTQEELQAYMDGLNYSVEKYYETRNTTSATHYYTQQAKPLAAGMAQVSLDILAVYYYDHYDIDLNGSPDKSVYTANGLLSASNTQLKPKSRATLVKRKVMETSNWLKTYMFYDHAGRLVQTIGNNIMAIGSELDYSTFKYNTLSQLEIAEESHYNGTASYTTNVKYAYYDNGLLKTVEQKMGAASYQLLATYNYDFLGRVKEKNLGYKGGDMALQASYLQSVDYAYNIRSWLIKINSSDLPVVSGEAQDVFGQELIYQAPTTLDAPTLPQYNGNIAAVKWKSKFGGAINPQNERAYRFLYDKSDRLKSADYSAKGTTTWNQEVNAYDLSIGEYDYNGNIKKLTRSHKEDATQAVQIIDDLSYEYEGNRLKKVDDTKVNISGLGFQNTNTQSIEYYYDALGNMITDHNKGTTLEYNVLNKTQKIKEDDNNYQEHSYDAFGSKLYKAIYGNGSLQVATYFVGSFEFDKNKELVSVATVEGRVVKQGIAYEYQYLLSDYQGNTRIVFKNNGGVADVLQENHFDPLGLPLKGVAIGRGNPNPSYRYLYNGPGEWQEDSYAQYHSTPFREYDPAIGRFHAVDLMAAYYSSRSPYVYAGNNPVSNNDPTGLYDNNTSYASGYSRYRAMKSNFGGNSEEDYYEMAGWSPGDNAFNTVGGGGGTGFGNHWTNGYRSVDGNAMMMSSTKFNSYYGINNDNREDFAKMLGVEANVYISSSDLLGESKLIDQGAAATAWIFNGSLIDVTYGGTLVWGEIYGDPHIINGTSVLTSGYSAREPYYGLKGELEYAWTGGVENGVRYDRDGKSLGLAPITGAPNSFLLPGGVGGAASIANLKTVLASWKNVNFKSVASAIKYHMKHADGKSIFTYTDDALNFFKANKGLGKEVMLKDGATGIKIRFGGNQPGGIFTLDGKIVTFWYK